MEWIVIMLQHPRSQADLAATFLLGLATDQMDALVSAWVSPVHSIDFSLARHQVVHHLETASPRSNVEGSSLVIVTHIRVHPIVNEPGQLAHVTSSSCSTQVAGSILIPVS